MLTRNGISYNLGVSPYTFTNGYLTLHFSSKFYLEKFKEEYMQHREDFSFRVSSRYHVNVFFKNTADIVLYSKIEKRGFMVTLFKDGCVQRYDSINKLKFIGDFLYDE